VEGPRSATMTGPRTAATAGALTATLGLAGASWVVAVPQMNGMDMGAATELGSFPFFVPLWVSMMAAMMLPGVAPAALRHAHASVRARAVHATYTREAPGMSAFVLRDGVVYHTYSAYARGLDGLWGVYQWLDRAPRGRNETGNPFWFRRHDEYDKG
jgi:Bacterial protein of unknown function (DUF899)